MAQPSTGAISLGTFYGNLLATTYGAGSNLSAHTLSTHYNLVIPDDFSSFYSKQAPATLSAAWATWYPSSAAQTSASFAINLLPTGTLTWRAEDSSISWMSETTDNVNDLCTITVTTNTGAYRDANCFIYCDQNTNIYDVVYVGQAAAAAGNLSIDPGTYVSDWDSNFCLGDGTVNVYCSGSWTTTISHAWMHLSLTSSSGNRSTILSVDANETNYEVNGTITFHSSGLSDVILYVTVMGQLESCA